MTITKGRIDRTGCVMFHDAKIAIWEDGISGARAIGGWEGEKKWTREFKRDVFLRIVQLLNRLGWTCVVPVELVKQYGRSFAESYRYCRKGDLQGELSISGRCVNFEMWQDVQNGENRNGGKYDFEKEKCMTYLQRLEMERTRRRIRDYLCNVFTGYEFEAPREPKMGLLGITALEAAANSRRTSGHYVAELDHARIYPGSRNDQAADGGTIAHGSKVWAIDYRGRIVTGMAFYSLNNNWHIVTGKYGLLCTHTGRIFTIQPDNLRIKRNSDQRRERLEHELAKAVETMNFERAAVLRDIAFPGNPQLFNVWHDEHKLYHCAGFCGYTSQQAKAGKFTADEVRSWNTAPNQVIPISSMAIAA